MIKRQVVGDIINKLQINLEDLRHKLCSLILVKELTDNEVISCSQELDTLILEYQQKINFEQYLGKILNYIINSTENN